MNKVTWKDELIRGLKHFGGEAHRKELFEYIKKTTNKKITKEFVRTLQKELERFSRDSTNFGGIDIFYSVEGIGSGIWGLNSYDKNIDIIQNDIDYSKKRKE